MNFESQQFDRVYTRACSFVLLALLMLLGSSAELRAATVTATWNPNPEPNIAGYQLSYGTTSGAYTTTIDVGKVTSVAVTMGNNATYYFAVRAYNTAGLIGPYSAEATVTTTTSSTGSTSPPTGSGSPSAPSTPAAIGFVQSNYATPQTPTASVVVPFTAVQTAGDLNAVVVGWNDSTQSVQAVKDSSGNVYVRAVGPTVVAGLLSQSIYYAKNIGAAAAGANAVTVTFTGAAVYPDVRIAEYRGLDTANPLDGAIGATGTSTTSDSGTLTTTSPNDLLMGANTVDHTTSAAGTGYTTRVITAPDADILEDRVVSTVGNYNVTATQTAGNWVMQLVAFRAASASSNGTTIAPSITSLSPVSGPAGTVVTITGTNFGSTKGTVTFNGTPATPTSWSSSSIVVPAPSGATTGNVVVTVGTVSSNGQLFTVTSTAPSITSLSPVSGPVGTVMTITGTNFGSTKGTVTFNGTPATPTSWSASSIVAPVPSGATTGNVVVTAGSVSSNGQLFTVTSTAPSITSLSPVSGPVGTVVTITGTNFGSTKSTVTFNGASATPTSWSASSIVVPVPSGATTGNVVVTVGSTSSNGKQFTMTAPATVSLVQHIDVDAGSVASTSVAFSSANAGGNFIVLAIRAGTPNQTFTISDTRGNTYKQAVRFNNNADDTVALYYAENVKAGANTVAVTMTSAVSLRFSLFEYQGIAVSSSIDGVQTASGTGASANSGAVTTTANGDLVIGVVSTANAAAVTPGSGFAVEGAVPALPGAKLVVEDAVLASAGSIAGNATLAASDQWGAAVAAFKAAGSSATTPTITSLAPGNGPVGTVVTITGANFGSTTGTVTFNGAPATPTSWSASSIVVSVPSNATTGNVVVTVGSAPSNGQRFTVMVPATVSLVQHVNVDAGSLASTATAFPSANTGGNFIALAIRAGTPNQTFMISDTRGNVYQQAVRFNNNADSTVALYYAENVGAGANTVTITMPTAVSLRFSLFEYQGIAVSGSIDGAQTAAGTGASASSGALTTTANGDLLIGVVSTANAANVTPGSGFAVEGAVPALPGAKLVVEDAVLATAGSMAGNATLAASDQWGAAVAAFKAASVPSSSSAAMMSAATHAPIPDDSSRASDYDGDGRADLAVFTPSTGKWSVLQSSSNYMNSFSLNLGTSTDIPVPGDYDGDGKTDVAIFTSSTGKWTVMKSTSAFASSMSTSWGTSGDVPVPGDYDGDGKTDFAIYRPSTGEWWLTLSATQTTRTIVLGTAGDRPVAGDYDGDGLTDLAIFRPSTGTWIVLTSSSNYSSQLTGSVGTSSDLLVPGDYDGDGRTDMAVYRPSTGSWLILGSATGFSTTRTVTLGSSADIPVPSDYDADGITDVAIYRPTTGQWSIVKSSDGSTLTSVWGTSGADVPLPRHP